MRRRGLRLPSIAGPDSLSYLDWYKTTIPPQWEVPRHIEFLCLQVQRLIDGEIQRLCLSVPPGHAKSSTITHRLPVYWGPRHPRDAIVLTGYNQDFANRQLSQPARELAREEGVLGNATALNYWEFSTGARLVARGVGAAPTGVNPISLFVCDDPFKDRAQAASETERENVWQWWTGSIIQRFWPRTRAIVIATRWHEDDLIGRLKASGDPSWTFVNLPAVAIENDPLGREFGEALWPGGKPRDFLDAQKVGMGEYEFEALFQGNPSPRQGDFFRVSMLRRVRVVPAGLASCRGWDLAASESPTADWTAGPRWSGPDADGVFYVQPLRFRAEPGERNRRIRATAERDGTSVKIRVPQDPGAGGKEAAMNLVRVLAGYPVRAEPVSGDKYLRAEPQAAQINAGNVRIVDDGTPEGTKAADDFIEEYRQAPNGRHDDQIDGSSDAFNDLAVPQGEFLC